jgi:hypothetical protein
VKKLILALTILASAANAAVWERPAGGYTPTNHSVNITKYQTDRANNVAISSVKVDGDLNKAFEGLNNLEARSAPSVVGQAGKFLTNNGAATAWGLVSTTSISSGPSAAGYVLKADGSGSTQFGLLDVTSFPDLGVAGSYVAPVLSVNAAGLVTSITSSEVISGTTVSASLVRGTTVSASTLTVSGTNVIPAILPIASAYISTTATSCSVISATNITGCTRLTTGHFGISGTFVGNTYKPQCSIHYAAGGSGIVMSIPGGGIANQRPTPTGFYTSTINLGGTAVYIDNVQFSCVVFP